MMITHDKMVERKWWLGRDMVWELVGVRGCVLWPTGHSLVTLFPYLCWLRTGHYISLEASHRFIIPSTYLCMGAWKTCCSLIADPALSGPTVRVCFWWRRSLHRTESGTQGRGLGVPVWTGTWTPGTGEWWVGPACAWGTSGACVFGVPSWGHWFANRRAIRYGLSTV